MVRINANLDLKTADIIDTGRLNQTLEDLSDDVLFITFVARDVSFFNGARRFKNKTHMHVVLPYEEVSATDNIELLALDYLDQNLNQLRWMDIESMRIKLKAKMAIVA